jgi:hypothetical protein
MVDLKEGKEVSSPDLLGNGVVAIIEGPGRIPKAIMVASVMRVSGVPDRVFYVDLQDQEIIRRVLSGTTKKAEALADLRVLQVIPRPPDPDEV